MNIQKFLNDWIIPIRQSIEEAIAITETELVILSTNEINRLETIRSKIWELEQLLFRRQPDGS